MAVVPSAPVFPVHISAAMRVGHVVGAGRSARAQLQRGCILQLHQIGQAKILQAALAADFASGLYLRVSGWLHSGR